MHFLYWYAHILIFVQILTWIWCSSCRYDVVTHLLSRKFINLFFIINIFACKHFDVLHNIFAFCFYKLDIWNYFTMPQRNDLPGSVTFTLWMMWLGSKISPSLPTRTDIKASSTSLWVTSLLSFRSSLNERANSSSEDSLSWDQTPIIWSPKVDVLNAARICYIEAQDSYDCQV